MTLGHFIYIPGILLLGLIIGYVLGGRASAVAGEELVEKDARTAARDARRRARASQAEQSAPPH